MRVNYGGQDCDCLIFFVIKGEKFNKLEKRIIFS